MTYGETSVSTGRTDQEQPEVDEKAARDIERGIEHSLVIRPSLLAERTRLAGFIAKSYNPQPNPNPHQPPSRPLFQHNHKSPSTDD